MVRRRHMSRATRSRRSPQLAPRDLTPIMISQRESMMLRVIVDPESKKLGAILAEASRIVGAWVGRRIVTEIARRAAHRAMIGMARRTS